jgi:hypothetical protein
VEGGSDQWLRMPYAKPEDMLVQAVRVMAETWNAHPRDARHHRDAVKRLIA